MCEISVCIPVYNFEVEALIFALIKEIDKKKLAVEIILIDDASDEYFKTKNRAIKPHIQQYIELPQNIGRSSIRNHFTHYARGAFLLFLDCDSQIISEDFIENYLTFIKTNPAAKVVYGSRIASPKPTSSDFLLRWKYAVKREISSLEKRLNNPYLTFQTGNFLINKETLIQNKFNEKIKKYGYEDIVLALDLKENKIKIDHINNPVLNDDLEKNEVFLHKVEDTVETLFHLLNSEKKANQLQMIKLVSAYLFLRNWKLISCYHQIFKKYKPLIKTDLISGNASLRKLDFYKLGLLIDFFETNTNQDVTTT